MKRIFLGLSAFCFLFSSSDVLAKKKPQRNPASEVVKMPTPNLEELTALVASYKIKNDGKVADRTPSGAARPSEDLISPEMKKLRDKLISVRNGQALYDVLSDYNRRYESLKFNDTKFVVARMSTLLPFRGFIWRAVPLAHKVVVTQEALLATVKNYAEQVMINSPKSQIKAHLNFLSLPPPEAFTDEEVRFTSEGRLVAFLAGPVYDTLREAIRRLGKLPMYVIQPDGSKTPMVFDAKIRWGEQAFTADDSYDSYDRFKIVGDAEKYATIARYHRRMAGISQLAAYNYQGHLKLREEIGRKFGIDIVKSKSDIFSWGSDQDDNFIDGVTREERVKIISGNKYTGLYKKQSQEWMNSAYTNLEGAHISLTKAWDAIKHNNDKTSWDYQMLDPEVLVGRKEQIESGLSNMSIMFSSPGQPIKSAMSGDQLVVNLKGFYDSAPDDLKDLLPTQFDHNEDADVVSFVKNSEGQLKFKDQKKSDIILMTKNKKTQPWRNYFYGRATGWSSEKYSKLFPCIGGTGGEECKNHVNSKLTVADAMRILNETRGARMLATNITPFIR
ncbi:MAG: hypothetical protein A4S09_13820 [Proteobacteria bacterium SG_bin7]|nr:MAG: hypothetical protein A4S09_13820 [Proteobacteria bacterium SG_bin7]